MSGHIDLMKREMRKPGGGDAEKLAQSMNATFYARKKLIGEKLSLELFHVYPALTVEHEVYSEETDGIDAETDVGAAVQKYGSQILSLAFDNRKKPKMPDVAHSYV